MYKMVGDKSTYWSDSDRMLPSPHQARHKGVVYPKRVLFLDVLEPRVLEALSPVDAAEKDLVEPLDGHGRHAPLFGLGDLLAGLDVFVVTGHRPADDGVVVLGEVAGVLGACHLDHVLDPVPVSFDESSQGENHVLARLVEAAKRKKL